jgi:hypothetical protein
LGSTQTAARREPWPLYTGTKRSRREADHSLVSSAKVMNACLPEGPSSTPVLAALTVHMRSWLAPAVVQPVTGMCTEQAVFVYI